MPTKLHNLSRWGAIAAAATVLGVLAGCYPVMSEPPDAVSMSIDEEGQFSWVFCDALEVQEVRVRYAPKDQFTYEFEEIWRIGTRGEYVGGLILFGITPNGWSTEASPIAIEPEGKYIDISAAQLSASGALRDARFGTFDGDRLVVGQWLGADGQLRSAPCER